MAEKGKTEAGSDANLTTTERKNDRDLFIRRSFNAPARMVFEAWTKPELFKRWWAPKSIGMTILSCEMDIRVGGGYRLEFGHPNFDRPMVFFGKYIEVVPNKRLAWTNEESEEGAVTTVTLEEKAGKTLLVLHERYPTKAAFDASEGMDAAMPEQFGQLDALLVSLGAGG